MARVLLVDHFYSFGLFFLVDWVSSRSLGSKSSPLDMFLSFTRFDFLFLGNFYDRLDAVASHGRMNIIKHCDAGGTFLIVSLNNWCFLFRPLSYFLNSLDPEFAPDFWRSHVVSHVGNKWASRRRNAWLPSSRHEFCQKIRFQSMLAQCRRHHTTWSHWVGILQSIFTNVVSLATILARQ